MKDTQIELGTHNEIIKAENLISAFKIPSNIELQLYGNLSATALPCNISARLLGTWSPSFKVSTRLVYDIKSNSVVFFSFVK